MGRQLVRLTDTIVGAGFDDQYRPRMAVVRADVEEVWMRRWRHGQIVYMASQDRHRSWEDRVDASKRIRVEGPEDDRIGQPERSRNWASLEAVATTPSIPPAFRPKYHLRNYHILWEANWRALRSAKRAPKDPALIKHLGGELWAVLAIWDLTDVERVALEVGLV